jgi:hypothetical protein
LAYRLWDWACKRVTGQVSVFHFVSIQHPNPCLSKSIKKKKTTYIPVSDVNLPKSAGRDPVIPQSAISLYKWKINVYVKNFGRENEEK